MWFMRIMWLPSYYFLFSSTFAYLMEWHRLQFYRKPHLYLSDGIVFEWFFQCIWAHVVWLSESERLIIGDWFWIYFKVHVHISEKPFSHQFITSQVTLFRTKISSYLYFRICSFSRSFKKWNKSTRMSWVIYYQQNGSFAGLVASSAIVHVSQTFSSVIFIALHFHRISCSYL